MVGKCVVHLIELRFLPSFFFASFVSSLLQFQIVVVRSMSGRFYRTFCKVEDVLAEEDENVLAGKVRV